jgi:hypothetical protein
MKLLLLCVVTLWSTLLFASDGKVLADQLGLSAGSKAIKQWERVFEKPKKMARMGIDKLSDAEVEVLKEYLIGHAADSDQPAAAGL